MDARIQDELAELRRRAFSLHPDIDGDPAARARLVELEQLVLAEHAVSVVAVSGERFAMAPHGEAASRATLATVEPAAAPPTGAGRSDGTAPQPRRLRARRRDGWAVAAAAALVAAGVVVATPATPPRAVEEEVTIETASSAYSITRDGDARVLMEIPFGPWIDTSTLDFDVIWLLPTSDEIEWTAPVGEYYGWDIWVAGTDDEPEKQHCLLAVHGQVARARCIPAALRPFSALVVTLPYRAIEADERPPGFLPGERIGFWWRADDAVTVLLAPAAPED